VSITEDLETYMNTNAARAVDGLSPGQRAITYGTFWARFDRDVPMFGKVATEAEAVPTGHPAMAREFQLRTLRERHERGFMYGWYYSVDLLDGERGDVHRSNIWPIPAIMFSAMRKVDWDPEALEVDMKMALMVHHSAWHKFVTS
jgi:hypothetical protein